MPPGRHRPGANPTRAASGGTVRTEIASAGHRGRTTIEARVKQVGLDGSGSADAGARGAGGGARGAGGAGERHGGGRGQVRKLVTSAAFARLRVRATTVAHAQLVKVLSGRCLRPRVLRSYLTCRYTMQNAPNSTQ